MSAMEDREVAILCGGPADGREITPPCPGYPTHISIRVPGHLKPRKVVYKHVGCGVYVLANAEVTQP